MIYRETVRFVFCLSSVSHLRRRRFRVSIETEYSSSWSSDQSAPYRLYAFQRTVHLLFTDQVINRLGKHCYWIPSLNPPSTISLQFHFSSSKASGGSTIKRLASLQSIASYQSIKTKQSPYFLKKWLMLEFSFLIWNRVDVLRLGYCVSGRQGTSSEVMNWCPWICSCLIRMWLQGILGFKTHIFIDFWKCKRLCSYLWDLFCFLC